MPEQIDSSDVDWKATAETMQQEITTMRGLVKNAIGAIEAGNELGIVKLLLIMAVPDA